MLGPGEGDGPGFDMRENWSLDLTFVRSNDEESDNVQM